MTEELLLVAELVVLAAALPLAAIAALGFKGSPFGKVVVPIPVVMLAFLLADASLLLAGNGHPLIYHVFAAVGVAGAIYAAFNAVMLLTERRAV